MARLCFRIARISLLGAVVLTVLNILMDVWDIGGYLLFSISFPRYEFNPYNAVMMIVSAAVLVFYFLAWLYSGKKPGWLTAAMIAFAIDCVYLAVFSVFSVKIACGMVTYADFMIDYAVHLWVLVFLIISVRNIKKNRDVLYPPAEEEPAAPDQTAESSGEPAPSMPDAAEIKEVPAENVK